MSANVATAPASSSRGMLGAHSARRRVKVEEFMRCALQKAKRAQRRAAMFFRSKKALFRFGWNATFPTRFMVRPLLFAKDFQAGE